MAPDHAPEAEQEDAFVLLQVTVVLPPPEGRFEGLAERETEGAPGVGTTVTETLPDPVPPGPVHVRVKVESFVTDTASDPLVALAPDHAPDAVHDVAPDVLQVMEVLPPPTGRLAGLADTDTTGARGTFTTEKVHEDGLEVLPKES